MKSHIIFFSTLITSMCVTPSLRAQVTDSVTTNKTLKNTIRFNLSSTLIFGDHYLVFGYERMVGVNQSFSVNVGSFGLPNFVNTDSLKVGAARKDKGFNISADYRFYLARENRRPAPYGVYIGPYYSYNYLNRENDWSFNNESFNGSVSSLLTVNIHTIGAELGYQFIFGRTFALDLICFGPGIANYNFKADINAGLNSDDKSELLNTIEQRIQQKIPGSGAFLNTEGFKKNSGAATWFLGYRYIVHIGYRF